MTANGATANGAARYREAMALRHLLLLIYLSIAVLSLTGLLFRDLSTADGLILGLPVGLAWVTGWAALTPMVMWAYMATEPGESGAAEGGEEA